MSSLWAASITVLPPGTWTGLPSTSRLIVVIGASDVVRDEALLMLDVVQELVAKVLDEALHRQLRDRGSEPQFVFARADDVARHREDLGAAVVGSPQVQKRLAAVRDDPRDRGEGLGVVDRRRLAVQTITRRERRLVARHPLLAFQGFKECRFFAADVRAVAVMVVQMEREAAAQDIVA